MGLPRLIRESLANLIGTIGILLLLYWLIIITYRLYLIRNKRKKYLNSPELDPRAHSQILYTFTTVRNRDICLIALILLEILIVVTSSFALPSVAQYAHKHVPIFSDCSHLSALVASAYTHPVYGLFLTTICLLVITQLLLISFLNSYLAGRYFGHSFPKKVTYKYIFVWVFQCVLQTISMIPKLQILFLPTTTLLLFLNWLNVIASSRKLSRAIRSKIKEIRLFEWNPTQFRNQSRNLKQYTIAMGFLISAFFLLTVALLFLTISFFLNILVSNCYFSVVYGINLRIDANFTNGIHNNIEELGDWIGYSIVVSFAILLLLPSLILVLFYLLNSLYDRCTGKGNAYKVNKMLSEPLLNH